MWSGGESLSDPGGGSWMESLAPITPRLFSRSLNHCQKVTGHDRGRVSGTFHNLLKGPSQFL